MQSTVTSGVVGRVMRGSLQAVAGGAISGEDGCVRFGSLWRYGVAACLLVLGGCGNAHEQATGTYAFTATEIVQDACGLLADPESLWDGHVFVSGQRVWIEYELLDTRLVGEFQEVSDTFIADGTASNVVTEVGAQSCALDYVSIHLEGTKESDTVFAGAMKVLFRADGTPHCRCDLEVRYRAERIGD